MKIAVMGAGAIGGYYGARLAEAGDEVHFIARGAHLAAMRERGLRVASELGDAHVRPVRATDDPAGIGPVDAVIFAVKLWDTEAAGAACKPLIGPDTAVISIQNGVEAEDTLGRILGPEHVMGGVAFIFGLVTEPGVIEHYGERTRLTFGEPDGRRSPRAQALLDRLLAAGIDGVLSDNIQKDIWEKFIYLVALAGVTAVSHLPLGPILADPDTREMFITVMDEAVAVGQARGAPVTPETAAERLAVADTLPGSVSSSMRHDLERGNRLELPWLNGAIVRMGREKGVPTPVNRFIETALKHHVMGPPV